MNILIIDLGYYNFYRFYATKQWYKSANPDDKFEDGYDWSQNEVFWNKFFKMFISTIEKYIKKFKIDKVIIAKDCKRCTIWRTLLFKEYKANREENYKKTNFQGGKVFKKSYEKIIPELLKNDNFKMIKCKSLEADDIIAICVKKLKKNKNNNLWVVSSDHDLLQLIDENITLMDAKMKSYNHKSYGTPDKDVFMKVVVGDKSDNIPQVFKRVGVKTALKLYDDKKLLLAKFRDDKKSFERFCFNKLLIDFKYIPIDINKIKIKL
jgi:5'-3' exonuclease